ncbi:hypothetical protein ONS95_014086 [Cadophora gregata]|uniref:uncharacterized protein n=1 Tax=Cadophora gregata TaxID=51156 RepID=UPI0026DD574C|nr:uncharacterized protein ONS95_014086 [Cadophora gregata]KAK0113839.1 hypothetical protein ONS96_014692 [Cadophora gregata f. sp. sojae]KAK0114600.1 hypothetical protein ONS95_014086 [Cadophora gregata]
MSQHRPFNGSNRAFILAAKQSRRQYRMEGWHRVEVQQSICDRLEEEDETCDPLCLHCREEFHSMDDFYDHEQADCWVAISRLQVEQEWSPALFAYVRRAVNPENRVPGWTTPDIIKSLEAMIMSNDRVGAAWETLELPQHIAQPEPVVKIIRPFELLGFTESKSPAPLVYADVFDPKYSVDPTPRGLFEHSDGLPFVAHRDPGEMLVYSDGACPNNGTAFARGGCSYIFRCSDDVSRPWNIPRGAYCMHGAFFFRLEDVGPTNKREQPTSNRAELRAAIAALRCIGSDQNQARISFSVPKDKSKLVVAMDSEYVVRGATKWSKDWERNGWRSSYGTVVKNQDLWKELLARVRELLSQQCAKVSFWRISRELNGDADRLAKYAATLKARPRFGVPAAGALQILVDPSQT